MRPTIISRAHERLDAVSCGHTCPASTLPQPIQADAVTVGSACHVRLLENVQRTWDGGKMIQTWAAAGGSLLPIVGECSCRPTSPSCAHRIGRSLPLHRFLRSTFHQFYSHASTHCQLVHQRLRRSSASAARWMRRRRKWRLSSFSTRRILTRGAIPFRRCPFHAAPASEEHSHRRHHYRRHR